MTSTRARDEPTRCCHATIPDRNNADCDHIEPSAATALARGAAGLVLLSALAALPTAAHGQSFDTVATWNRILNEAVVVPGANPPTIFVHRPMAIVFFGVFDAANSFNRTLYPYATWVDPAPGASRDAAVAQAARRPLVAVLPSLQATFDAALAASLAGIPAQAARAGAAVGAAAPQAILRGAGDRRVGSHVVLAALAARLLEAHATGGPGGDVHALPRRPGLHHRERRAVPDGAAAPAYEPAGSVMDFNEVKAIGRADSAVRTAEHTQMARLWHGVGTSTTSPALCGTLCPTWRASVAGLAWTSLAASRYRTWRSTTRS